ncbi:cupin-like domain-containing protein [Pedobacter sp. HMF7647]|uniref:Cupin-like domain-containing protein n=1 Tax=Hufsiella arboris TaxID=2695275 RepID=A0A7K1YBF7_9SPHI|nr:cupin-like domain-containing protein [Hufsiella arboris]MXV51915.1 cupin-like domain-containing protein [Hufsiella arboris]
MDLLPIETISASDGVFIDKYFNKNIPVVIKDFAKGSEALEKWNFEYLKTIAGEMPVSLHGKEDSFAEHVTSPPVKQMPFGEYLDLIQRGPTDLRIFLFNLMREKPELRKDLRLMKGIPNLLEWLPFMFFGGEGSSVRYHYDIDYSHVFLMQFQGRKRVWLFDQQQSRLLYKLPFNFHGIANLKNPDYEKYPALKNLKGWEYVLEHGDTLFIPQKFWHYIQYETGGYSVSYRALPESYIDRLKGLKNIVLVRQFDNLMRNMFGKRWFRYKIDRAIANAQNALRNKAA